MKIVFLLSQPSEPIEIQLLVVDKSLSSIVANGTDRRHCSTRGCCIIPRMFLLSKYLGVFPFSVVKNKFHQSKYYFPTLLTMFCFAIIRLDNINTFIGSYLKNADIKRFKKLFIFSRQFLSLTPIVSIIWIKCNKKRIAKVFKTVIAVQNLTNFSYKSSDWIGILFMSYYSIICLIPIVYRCALTKSYTCKYPVMGAITDILNNSQTLLVIFQFVYLGNQLRYQFTSLSLTLSKENAVGWIKWRRALGANCHNLSRCYSPQILLFVGDFFIRAITDIYVAIMSTHYRFHIVHNVISSLLNFSSIGLICYIVYICSETANKAKKFDKTLCQLTINDTTGTLLKNKKIILHFKANQKVEFSVLIFFNLDYTFLCTMIYTATTYIVILVQFS
ncbi:Gustatory receptor 91a [Halyomorpha halys]|nr:Gustatory receptor 91a [Halyomorpha halys]